MRRAWCVVHKWREGIRRSVCSSTNKLRLNQTNLLFFFATSAVCLLWLLQPCEHWWVQFQNCLTPETYCIKTSQIKSMSAGSEETSISRASVTDSSAIIISDSHIPELHFFPPKSLLKKVTAWAYSWFTFCYVWILALGSWLLALCDFDFAQTDRQTEPADCGLGSVCALVHRGSHHMLMVLWALVCSHIEFINEHALIHSNKAPTK